MCKLHLMKPLKIIGTVLFFLILIAYRWICSTDGSFFTTFILVVIDMLSIIIATTIINRFFVPRLLYKKQFFLFVLSFLCCNIFFSLFLQFVDWEVHRIRGTLTPGFIELSQSLFYQIFNTYIVIFVGTLFGISIELLQNRITTDKQMALLIQEKTRAELDFLNAQINPHFLFNSINTIFFQIEKENAAARNSLVKFSEMLRYQLYDCRASEIAIEKEIAYLRSYVELQSLRKEENFRISFNCSEEVKQFCIAPLILISFVENAFKHVSNNSEIDNAIEISLDRSNGSFNFRVYNTVDGCIIKHENKNGGIGLENVKRRMELIYNGKHSLQISKSDKAFEVNLELRHE